MGTLTVDEEEVPGYRRVCALESTRSCIREDTGGHGRTREDTEGHGRTREAVSEQAVRARVYVEHVGGSTALVSTSPNPPHGP